MPSLFKWLNEHTRIRADMKYKGGLLRLTDPDILDAPLIFMTGHDKDITVSRSMEKGEPLADGFSTEERAALWRYIIERGGTLFFVDCGFYGLFAAQVAQGRGTTDAGGYRIGTSKFAYQKGISIGTRLAVVYNRKDYLCLMETTEVDSRQG